MFGAAIWIYTHIEPGMIEQNDAVDGTVVLHLKSRSVTSFLLELRRIAWPLRIHLLQHGLPAKDDTHRHVHLLFMAQEK